MSSDTHFRAGAEKALAANPQGGGVAQTMVAAVTAWCDRMTARLRG